MLNITQVMRIRAGVMIDVNGENYPNVLDAVRFHYRYNKTPEECIPVSFKLGVNKVYLDRLEYFIDKQLDLPEFYQFVQGRDGKFNKIVSFPMCKNTLVFIIESLEEKNNHESLPIRKEITLPANGGAIPMPPGRFVYNYL